MDHNQAVQTQVSMRYILGELTTAERDEFEEHYADCSRCMSDLEMTAAFAANARRVFRDRVDVGENSSWLAWLRWRPLPTLALSAALNLVLVAGLGVELFRGRPSVPALSGRGGAAAELESVDLTDISGTTRGSAKAERVIHVTSRPVVVRIDLLRSYEHYLYSIDREGTPVLSREVPVPGRPDSLNLRIPTALLPAGKYVFTVTGVQGAVHEILGTCLLQVESQ
jgi:anti-sigma factor RsiW